MNSSGSGFSATPAIGLSDPFPPALLSSYNPSTVSVRARSRDHDSAQIQQWNLAAEMPLPWQSRVEVAYVGNRGDNLLVNLPINTVQWGANWCERIRRGQPSVSDLAHWLDLAAYAVQPVNTPGNARAADAFGPGAWTTDLSLVKRLRSDRFSADVCAEAFNLFNTVNYGNPNTSYPSAPFGPSRVLAIRGSCSWRCAWGSEGYPAMRRSRLRLPLRIISLSASLRNGASSTRSTVTGQLKGTSVP